jgi:hypothetical protein
MYKMPLIGFNSNAGSGSTTCAKFINQPVLSLTGELYDIYNMLYEPEYDNSNDTNIDTKIICTRKNTSFVHSFLTIEDVEKIDIPEKTTIRYITLLLDKIIRDKDPYYFVKRYSEKIKTDKHLSITDIKTDIEAMFLKTIRPDLVIIQVRRLTEHEGIYDGHILDKRYITKQLLNISDLGTLEIKLKVILSDIFGR